MISRVAITNFKSIGDPGVDLELKPLTLLVGPNGGGKSSVLEAIAVVTQGDITGKLVSFPSSTDLIHKPDSTEATVAIYSTSYVENDDPVGWRLQFRPSGLNYERLIGPDPWASIASRQDYSQWAAFLDELNPNTFLISSVRGEVPYDTDSEVYLDGVGVNGQNLLPLLALMLTSGEY